MAKETCSYQGSHRKGEHHQGCLYHYHNTPQPGSFHGDHQLHKTPIDLQPPPCSPLPLPCLRPPRQGPGGQLHLAAPRGPGSHHVQLSPGGPSRPVGEGAVSGGMALAPHLSPLPTPCGNLGTDGENPGILAPFPALP